MEILAISENWDIIEEFKDFAEADKFSGEFYQIIYKEYEFEPIRVYKHGKIHVFDMNEIIKNNPF